jgi:hypothetical protein
VARNKSRTDSACGVTKAYYTIEVKHDRPALHKGGRRFIP